MSMKLLTAYGRRIELVKKKEFNIVKKKIALDTVP